MVNNHRYSSSEHEFMLSFVYGHSYKEIAKAFTEKFGWEISIGQVKAYIGRYKLNTGRTGRFTKGNISKNKGKKMSPEVYEKCFPTMFKKGRQSKNHRSVGSERTTKDGYIEIKVEEPNVWRLKHRIVFENINGPIPEGYIISFRDNDKTNTDISNLILIKKSVNLVMNNSGLSKYSENLKDVAINIAKLRIMTSKRKNRKRREDE